MFQLFVAMMSFSLSFFCTHAEIASGEVSTFVFQPGSSIVYGWGGNFDGQLGDGTTIPRSSPVLMVGLVNPVTDICPGLFYTAILSQGGVVTLFGAYAWTIPANTGIFQISCALDALCYLDSSFDLWCVGNNPSGELLTGDTWSLTTAMNVWADATLNYVGMGENHGCVIQNSNQVKCWGANYAGQCGDGTVTESPKLSAVGTFQASDSLIHINGGQQHTCALSSVGSVYCWGSNAEGNLNVGDLIDRYTPVLTFFTSASKLSVGGLTTCVISNNVVNCLGQLQGASALSGLSAIHVGAGGSHACIQTTTQIKCVGEGQDGQLGNGENEASGIPVDVAIPSQVPSQSPTETPVTPLK